MSSDASGGINFNGGAANGSKYEIKSGRDNNLVVFVCWYDSICQHCFHVPDGLVREFDLHTRSSFSIKISREPAEVKRDRVRYRTTCRDSTISSHVGLWTGRFSDQSVAPVEKFASWRMVH